MANCPDLSSGKLVKILDFTIDIVNGISMRARRHDFPEARRNLMGIFGVFESILVGLKEVVRVGKAMWEVSACWYLSSKLDKSRLHKKQQQQQQKHKTKKHKAKTKLRKQQQKYKTQKCANTNQSYKNLNFFLVVSERAEIKKCVTKAKATTKGNKKQRPGNQAPRGCRSSSKPLGRFTQNLPSLVIG